MRPAERPRRSFGDVAAAWLARVVRVRRENEERHLWYLCPLWHLREADAAERDDDLTKARIDDCFNALDKRNGGPLGPATLNKLRSTGKLAVDDAIANRRWHSANPFTYVQPRRVPRQPYPKITADELARALGHMRPDRMRECIWQIHVGTRPGEQKALRKCDVDLDRGFVTIHRSNARDETKTGIPREIPIPDGARAALVEAMRLSPSEFVFPRPDGTQQRHDVKLSKMLRSAFKAAGIVTGYRLTCRRKGCGYADEVLIEDRGRLCPSCGFKLWCEGIPKHFTWYGLRHAANNLHREMGADAYAVKVALGHAPRDVNDEFYSHLSDERFKAELAKLIIRPKA
jgi:integrase